MDIYNVEINEHKWTFIDIFLIISLAILLFCWSEWYEINLLYTFQGDK